jgi:hypothetical protein
MWFFCRINAILMQYLKILSLFVSCAKLGNGSVNLVFTPVFKPYRHKRFIFYDTALILSMHSMVPNFVNSVLLLLLYKLFVRITNFSFTWTEKFIDGVNYFKLILIRSYRIWISLSDNLKLYLTILIRTEQFKTMILSILL